MQEENREQPIMEQANSLNKELEESAVSEKIGSQNNDTEVNNLGKFKSQEALLEAYNNLQAEFTKKCQKLSEYEKEKTIVQTTAQDIEGELEKFLSTNNDAVSYAEEIKNELDAQINSDAKTQIEVAWAKVLQNKVLKEPKASDFVLNKYVLSDDEIKNKVIEEYLKSLKEQKIPVVISSNAGERVSSVEPDTPKTLAEAKTLVKKMFS